MCDSFIFWLHSSRHKSSVNFASSRSLLVSSVPAALHPTAGAASAVVFQHSPRIQGQVSSSWSSCTLRQPSPLAQPLRGKPENTSAWVTFTQRAVIQTLAFMLNFPAAVGQWGNCTSAVCSWLKLVGAVKVKVKVNYLAGDTSLLLYLPPQLLREFTFVKLKTHYLASIL